MDQSVAYRHRQRVTGCERASAVGPAAVTGGATFLYGSQLDRSPVYLNSDETMFAVQAHAIATTGRDESGRLLPVYFQMNENVWYYPAVVYAMAPFVAFVTPSPVVVRLPTVLVAVLTLGLVYKLARTLGVAGHAALAAPIVLALTPAFFMHGRLACDYMFPVPFMVTWMIFLVDYFRTHSTRSLVVASAALGVGFYTYVASVVMMPLFLGVTLAALLVDRPRTFSAPKLAVGTFLLCLVPWVVWLGTHTEVLATFATRYRDSRLGALEASDGVILQAVLTRLRVYASFFEPSFLFDVARASVMSSTYTTGVFLAGVQVLMPLGLYHMLRNRRSAGVYLVLLAFFLAPAAASLIDEQLRHRSRARAPAIRRDHRVVRCGVAAAETGTIPDLCAQVRARRHRDLDGLAIRRLSSRVLHRLSSASRVLVQQQSPWSARPDHQRPSCG